MNICIINGPNLNLLGLREPETYGTTRFEDYLLSLQNRFKMATVQYYQSNVEGELINKLHVTGFTADGIILNAGGYTHTSVALRDAIAGITTPVLEVHISNVYAREEFRKENLLAAVCIGSITGLGLEGYALALSFFTDYLKKNSPTT